MPAALPLPPPALLPPRPPRSTRAFRALGVAAVWGTGAVPLLLGAQRCTFALLFERPCPGCGMTRAIELLLAGEVAGSLRMHFFAVPVALVNALFAIATIAITYRAGSPLALWRYKGGRVLVYGAACVYAGMLVFFALRCFGMFGGPVPVSLDATE